VRTSAIPTDVRIPEVHKNKIQELSNEDVTVYTTK
jgi:hypothetical protein